jgi:hypothetical protein
VYVTLRLAPEHLCYLHTVTACSGSLPSPKDLSKRQRDVTMVMIKKKLLAVNYTAGRTPLAWPSLSKGKCFLCSETDRSVSQPGEDSSFPGIVGSDKWHASGTREGCNYPPWKGRKKQF